MNFERFMSLADSCVRLDPWVTDKDLEYTRFLLDEAKEVVEAVDKGDMSNLTEELGDILSIWAITCKIAEKKGLFTAKDVVENAIEKNLRRRPYILTNSIVTKEESARIWRDVKSEEKNAKG